MSIIIDILTGTMKLRDAWPKINSNFTGIKAEVDAIVTGSANAEVGQAHVSTVKSKTFTTLDDRLEEDEQDLVSAQADNTTQLSLKVDKVTDKGLSTNDYDAIEKAEVAKVALKADQTSLVTTNENVGANTSQISTNTSAMANIGNATPKGAYATLALLQSAFPTGTTGIYIVVADGNWYYWNSTAWTAGGVYQSTGIADNGITAPKVSALAFGKPFILIGLNPPNFDTVTKTLSFNSDATFKTMLFYKNTKYDIPVGTTVVDGVATSAVQLIFDTTNSTFSFIGHTIVPSETQVRVAVYKRLDGHYYWDFPCPITVDGKLFYPENSIGINALEANIKKWVLSYAYVGFGEQAIILESQGVGINHVYFNLPRDASTVAIRPEQGFSFSKTWTEIKALFPSSIVTVNGVDYIDIPEAYALVVNGATLTLEIIARTSISPFTHVAILVNSSGVCVSGKAVSWVNKYNLSLLSSRVTFVENATGVVIPSYFVDEITTTIDTVESVALNRSLVLSIVTDSHDDHDISYFTRTATNIHEVNKRVGSDAVVHLGDIISGSISRSVSMAKIGESVKLLKDSNRKILIANGNHDDSSYTAVDNRIFTKLILPDANYGITQRQTDSDATTVRDGNNGWFYIDYPDIKTRLIMLDSIDYPIIDVGGGVSKYAGDNGWGFGAEQLSWLGDTALKELGTGWGVLILAHMATRASLAYAGVPPTNGSHVEEILKAFKDGTTYNALTTGDWAVDHSFDFTIQGQREVIAYIYGHNHADLVAKPVDLGYTYISIANSYPGVIDSGTMPVGATAPTRTIGTVTEDCWDAMILRRDEGKIYMIRFGAGDDREVSY